MNNKKYIALLIATIVIVVIATTAVTFAYLSFNSVQSSSNNISTGCFDLEFSESASINLNGYPMSDTTGLKTTPYTFTFKNTCESTTNYQVILNIKNNTDLTLLNYINYSLDGTTVNLLSNATKIELPSEIISDDTISSYVLDVGNIAGTSETISYDLRLWISEDGGNNLMNKTFQAEVMIYSTAGTESNLN